jgi:hypothetical protein
MANTVKPTGPTLSVDSNQTPFASKAGKPKQDNPYLAFVSEHKDDKNPDDTAKVFKLEGFANAESVKRGVALVRRAGKDVERSVLVELYPEDKGFGFRFTIVPKITRNGANSQSVTVVGSDAVAATA